MESSCSSWMKCQYYHSFPMQISTTKSSCRPSYSYSNKSPASSIHFNHLSTKINYWAIKSKIKDDDDVTPAAIIREELNKSIRRKRRIITMTASIGLLVMLMGQDKAWALGPEGPLVEEFWENVRRYGLYALTVSTGVLYAVLQPIVELLKNPISAFLVILIFAATFFIFSQVLSAMFGVSDFAYQYAY